MNEQQVLDLAKKVFKEIEFKYYEDKPLKVSYNENEKFTDHLELAKTWTVNCRWFNPDFLDGMEKSGFLIINDDTGEPVVLMLATGGGGNCVIAKDQKGKYFVERNY